jgi:bifunctional non-homologous end joining protein LigD
MQRELRLLCLPIPPFTIIAMLPLFQPMLLGRRAEAFSHPDWLFELKYDGFRALANIEDGACRLVSRNGNTFKSFEGLTLALPKALRTRSAVLDGEIVCLDSDGHPNFSDLFYRRREPIFVAFDLLSASGQDMRHLPLVERKVELRRVKRPRASSILYCSHVESAGEALFSLACQHDLEGIVAKYKSAPYLSGRQDTTWFKIRNSSYSQWDGREEMFGRPEEPMITGWDSCAMAAAAGAN